MKNRTIIDVPLDKLHSHPNQPAHRNSVDELAASIKEIGLQEPILVSEDKDGWTIISGHRRRLAYEKLDFKTIPAQVVQGTSMEHPSSLAYTTQQLAASNTAREDFTVIQEAQVMQLMMELGIDSTKVAATMGRKKEDVEAVVSAIKTIASDTVTNLSEDTVLTTDEVLVLGEFAADSEATVTLLETLETGQFAHTTARLRKKREGNAAIAALTTALEDEKTPIIEQPRWDDKKIVRLESVGIAPKNHRTCLGHAAYITLNYENKATAVYVCLDAPAHHKYKPASTGQDRDKEKERAGHQFKKDMLAPTEVRRTFVKSMLMKNQPLKSQAGFLNFTASSARFRYDELTAEFMGKKHYEQLKTIRGEENNMRLLVAAACSYWDEETRLVQGPDHYRNRGLDFYLTFLKNNGYTISEHEQKLIDR